jgi:hypothetical protein
VLDLCRTARVPVAIAMAGDYSRNMIDTVDIHFSTVEVAAQFQSAPQQPGALCLAESR